MAEGQRDFSYVGGELELFREAHNWKNYLKDQIGPLIDGDVLEVGAGIGGTTQILYRQNCQSWTALEPDEEMIAILKDRVLKGELVEKIDLQQGCVSDLEADMTFDSILYIDVLEHIEDDLEEIRRAQEHLRPKGHLVVLSPAHEFLYSPFDKSIGHHRRYSKRDLARLQHDQLKLKSVRYLDSLGLFLSLGNAWLLKKPMPHKKDIMLWDRVFLPLSRYLDPLLAYRFGKSILYIWQKA